MLVGIYLSIGIICAILFFLSPYFFCYVSAFGEEEGEEKENKMPLLLVIIGGFLIVTTAWLPILVLAIVRSIIRY